MSRMDREEASGENGRVSCKFFKFPSTPHLTLLDCASVREDKVFTAAQQREFLSHEILVEEKLDGANLGISFDRYGSLQAQNRGNYLQLPSSGQWQLLHDWLNSRCDLLRKFLGTRYILFGEWCYATHSIFYDRLPDWFLGFDLFDTESRRFVSSSTRRNMFAQLEIQAVPAIAIGRFTLDEVVGLLQDSAFGTKPAEGLYLRRDEGAWLLQRAKIVRAGFVQSIEQHWSRQPLRLNQLKDSGAHASGGGRCG